MSQPIYVIAGKDESLRRSRCQELLDELIEPQQRATGVMTLNSKEADITVVLDELHTLPFLTKRRVVLIHEADTFVSKYRGSLETYFDNPCPTGVLILAVGSWPGNTKLAKKLTKVGMFISVDPPKPWYMPAQLCDIAKRQYKKTLSKEAGQLLVQLTGDDWSAVCRELDKLVTFAMDAPRITSEHVEQLVGHNRVFGAFDVIDALSVNNTSQALQRLRNMFAEDKNAQYTVVGAFAYHFRRLFTAKAMLSKGRSPQEVSTKLRLWGNKDRFLSQVKRLSLDQLGHWLQRLAHIDFEIKTGQGRPAVAMEQFILGVAGTNRL
jgi:DNA polymerase-3 subunit delta